MRIATALLCLFFVTACSDKNVENVEIDYPRIQQQSDELRRAGRCTSQALPPNEDTHLCGRRATHVYTMRTTLRTKSTGQVDTDTNFMNKCEAHYMDPDTIEANMRGLYADLPPHALVDLVSIDVSAESLDSD